MPSQALETTDDTVDDAIEQLTNTTTAALKKMESRFDKLEAKMGRPGAANDNHPPSTRHANDNNGDVAAEKKALADYVRHNIEMKDMSVGNDPSGGYTVTPQLSDQIVRRLYNQSVLRQICRVVEVGNFGSFEEPYQIGDAAAVWTSESAPRPSTTTPTLALLNVPVNELYATQPVTQRLVDDSRFDIAGFVMERAIDCFARTEGAAFVRGTGVAQPKGFMSYAVDSAADFTRDPNKLQFVASGTSGVVTFDGVKSLYWTMRAPHRATSSWLMSSATASQVDQLKDAQGRYIWRESIAADVPPTLLGRPVYFDENMDSVSSGTFPIAFGNWSRGYVIADKPGVRWLRDPYSSKPNLIFYGYRRVGGGVADFDAIKLLKVS